MVSYLIKEQLRLKKLIEMQVGLSLLVAKSAAKEVLDYNNVTDDANKKLLQSIIQTSVEPLILTEETKDIIQNKKNIDSLCEIRESVVLSFQKTDDELINSINSLFINRMNHFESNCLVFQKNKTHHDEKVFNNENEAAELLKKSINSN
jgi:hypothetical protein